MLSERVRGIAPPTIARFIRPAVCLELAKARLTALVLITTLVAYLLASQAAIQWGPLLWTLFGTALTAGGANALNQWGEVQRDSRMRRTRNRPLPTGRVHAAHALGGGLAAIATGCTVLFLRVNTITAALALAAAMIYVLLYTPLKPRSSLCTLVGAVCGAIPPMIGWTAATGRLGYGAWVLAVLLFLWQVPHFLALGWLHRDDYARGGFRVLPVTDASGRITCQVIVLYSMALLPSGLAAAAAGMTGPVYAIGCVVLGTGLVMLAVRLYCQRTEANAQRLFISTIVYLPLILGLMLVDRGPAHSVHIAASIARGP